MTDNDMLSPWSGTIIYQKLDETRKDTTRCDYELVPAIRTTSSIELGLEMGGSSDASDGRH